MKNTTKVNRSESTTLHASKYRTHHRVTVIIGGDWDEEQEFPSRREAQRYASERAKALEVRVTLETSRRGVQYAHQM